MNIVEITGIGSFVLGFVMAFEIGIPVEIPILLGLNGLFLIIIGVFISNAQTIERRLKKTSNEQTKKRNIQARASKNQQRDVSDSREHCR